MVRTSLTLRRDQWERLRREAEVTSLARGGKPDASAALRRVLDMAWEKLPALTVQDANPSEMARIAAEGMLFNDLTMELDRISKRDLEARKKELGALPVTGEDLKRFRKEKLGMSQAALARRLRVDTGTVSRWERSELISPETKVSVASVALLMASGKKSKRA
jgi:DNA-binding transcriptional regulator YiaG